MAGAHAEGRGRGVPLSEYCDAAELHRREGGLRLAAIQDAAKVALEMGNSPQMLFKHYRELVTPDAAKSWFAIQP